MIYELFLEGELADIRQDLGMQLSYNIDDVNKYGSRDTSFSKTIVLPGTAKNNKLLGFVGELGSNNPYANGAPNINSNFNPAQTTKAELRANGLLLLKGVFRLTGIIHDKGHIEYEGNLFGELGGFIAAIGGGKLEELDFSEYDHTYTRDNIVNSWDTINGAGYYYPLIDYGTYSTPEKNPGRVKRDYDFMTLRPALYVKEYIDKMFEPSGYTYESSFFDSAFFKKLIVPNNTANLKTITSRALIVQSNTYQSTESSNTSNNRIIPFNVYTFLGSFTTSNGKIFTYNSLNEINPIINLSLSDLQLIGASNEVNTIKFYFVIKKGSVINEYPLNGIDNLFSPDYSIPIERKTVNITDQTVDFFSKTIQFEDWPFTSNPPRFTTIILSGTSSNNGTYTIDIVDQSNKRLILTSNVSTDIDGNFSINYQPGMRSSTVFLGNYTINNLFINDSIANGNEVYILARGLGILGSIIRSIPKLEIISQNPVLNNILLNDTIIVKETIPRNIMQRDFFTWIIKMFNLYITEDKVKEKHLLIEPYIDYYDLSDPIDWTYKVARDKAWNIKPMGLLNGRFFEYKYKDDNDFYNEGYKKKYNLPYGSRLEDTSFQFAKDKQTIEIGFSPSVLIQYQNTDKVITAIYKKSSGNAVDQEERMDSNIRILMAKKMTGVASWYIRNNNISGSGGNLGDALTVYGYAGHFDDPVNPTKDINFGAASEIYFDPNVYPTNNLFNDYWSAYIAEIADKDSKLLTCHVYLTEMDIAQLDFSKPVFIDGVLWRINKIMDYDATNGELTKVELLKVINNG